MENASKALIIAASILIVLLLITMAVFLVRKVDFTELFTGKARSMEMEGFNKEFEAFATISGETRNGQEIKDLLSKVRTSNASNSDHPIHINGGDVAEFAVSSRQNYTVTLDYDNGFVSNITIVNAGSGGAAGGGEAGGGGEDEH